MKGESVQPAAPCPGLPRSCSEARPLHTRPACSHVMLANIPTDPWQPLQPTPLRWDLPGLPHLIVAGDFKFVSDVHAAVPVCFSAVSSIKPWQPPGPTQPSWRPDWDAGRAPTCCSHEANGAENAAALVLPHAVLPLSCTPTTD